MFWKQKWLQPRFKSIHRPCYPNMLGKVIPWLLKLSYWLLELFFFLTAHALLMTDCSGSPTDWLLTPFYSFSFSSAYWLLIVFYWLTALSYLLTARARRLSECSRSSAESLWMTRFTASGGQEQPVFHRVVQTCGCARRPRVHCLVRDPEVSAVPPLFIFFFSYLTNSERFKQLEFGHENKF